MDRVHVTSWYKILVSENVCCWNRPSFPATALPLHDRYERDVAMLTDLVTHTPCPLNPTSPAPTPAPPPKP